MFDDIAAFFGLKLVYLPTLEQVHEEEHQADACAYVFDKVMASAPKNQPRFISPVQAYVTEVDNKFIVIKFNREIQIRLFANGTWEFHERKN